jgi:hypothetical protein
MPQNPLNTTLQIYRALIFHPVEPITHRARWVGVGAHI